MKTGKFYTILMLAGFTAGLLGTAVAADDFNRIQDHYVEQTVSKPYTVRICKDKSTVEGAIGGAVIGGVIGAILGDSEGAKVGSIFGGIVGGDKAKNQKVCSNETRYDNSVETVYSHSTITFTNNGKQHTLRFQR